ncbi:unnamed protein product [Sphagnum jensenii]|uniref:Uncharacterized protein n=1 Tax=Sphagnum jensenii TaxID=128206 RepID=A0ABP1A195_9BRYO
MCAAVSKHNGLSAKSEVPGEMNDNMIATADSIESVPAATSVTDGQERAIHTPSRCAQSPRAALTSTAVDTPDEISTSN